MRTSEGREKEKRAESFARHAEKVISEVLGAGRWPRSQTVEKFIESGRLEKVLILYTAAIELDPDEPAYPWNLASTLRRLGLNDLALAFIERAVRVGRRIDPAEWATPGTYLAWADVAIDAEQYEVALIPIARALKENRDHPDVVASAKALVEIIKRKKGSSNPAQDLAEELELVPA